MLKRNFTVTNSGSVEEIRFKSTDEPSNNVDLRHVQRFSLDNDYSLLIDTFNDSIEIVNKLTERALFDDAFSGLNRSEKSYYAAKFKKNIPKLYKRYQDTISVTQKDSPLSYVICPTYSCNNRCVYCYQQFDPKLNRKTVSDENLSKIFEFILDDVAKKRIIHPNQAVDIELFGGEAFQPHQKNTIRQIFEFCRSNKFSISATTNATELNHFFDLLIPYRGYISRIGTTIDGGEAYHNSRRIYPKNKSQAFNLVVQNINVLLKAKIPVTVSINLDPNNMEELKEFIDTAKKNNWANNELVHLEIGRVDDRFFESSYTDMYLESQLFEKLIKFHQKSPFPNNIKFAFLKGSLYFAERFDLAFNQAESGRLKGNYCWATTPKDHVVYIDSNLDTYRCTYTVGKPQYKTGNLDLSHQQDLNPWFSHGLFHNKKCQECPIGGSCSGGCRISWGKDSDRQCNEELRNFNYAVHNIVIPLIKSKLENLINTGLLNNVDSEKIRSPKDLHQSKIPALNTESQK